METTFEREPAQDRLNPLSLRWLQRNDLPLVYRLLLNADKQGLADNHEDLVQCLESSDTVGLVAEHNGIIVGFLSYQLYREFNEVVIRRVNVAPPWRRQGIGTALLCRAALKLEQNYHLLTAVIPETELETQLFLRACGFRASAVLKEHFDDADAFLFEHRRRESETPRSATAEVVN